MADLTVGIVVFDGADELDVVGPYRTFAAVNAVREAIDGPEVRLELVAEEKRPLRFAFGLVTEPTTDYASCPPLDVLIVPGGGSALESGGRRHEMKNPPTLEFIRAQREKARHVGSVCTGAIVLAAAGLLANRKATTHWYYRDELREVMEQRGESIEVVSQRVVWDDPIVTGGGVTSGIDVALELIERLLGPKVRDAAAAELELTTPE